jgi:hypothetical protein
VNDEWYDKGYYIGYKLLAKGKQRRLVDEETGAIVVEYTIDE